MKFIDKSTHEADGKEIIDELLEKCWNVDEKKYLSADYDSLKKQDYRKPFTELLLKEQDSLCCYCMKHLDYQKTTLEHIIPQSIKNSDFDDYLAVPELDNNVIHSEKFDRKSKIIPPIKYPHDIAYHNLIASCDSNLHCNHFRGKSKIAPFFYDDTIEGLVIYDKAGRLACEKFEDDFSVLGISTNNLLKTIRYIWYKLSKKFANSNEINQQEVDDTIFELITESSIDTTNTIANFIGTPSYRDEVLKYKWFFDYYKKNIQNF